MIAQNLHRLKVEKSTRCLTSYAGLPLLTELAHHTGLLERLDALPGLWERHGDYSTSDYVLRLAMTLIAGGEGLDDTRLLKSDAGLSQLAFPDFPEPNSFGRFLGRFSHRSLYHFGELNAQEALRHVEAGQTVTLDIDSSLIEAEKEEAQKTYKGFTGYNPLLAWIDEADVFLGGVFRDGNASPQSHNVSLLRYCLRHLPEGVKLRVRSDSAAYQLDFMEQCVKAEAEFTITADLDTSVRDVIEKIPKSAWKLVRRGEDKFLMAETVHAPGSGSAQPLPSFRLLVTQRLNYQLDLFGDPIRYRAIISSFPESWSAEQILDHHNDRGRMEKALGELKNGFGLHRLPSGKLMGNAAFFQVGLLAYNLVRTFKRFSLPESWWGYGIKNLRFRLLCQAAIVVRHAKRVALKLSEGFGHFEIFEKARWAVLSPVLAPAVT